MVNTFAQTPEKINFQAVIRDSECIMPNKQIGITFLLSGESGPEIYVEKHEAQTNSTGWVSLNIGLGKKTKQTPDFSDINWKEEIYL